METVQMKVYVDADLVRWLESEEIRYQRSRSYLVNEALRRRMDQLEARRKKYVARARKGGKA